ncbi:hypothetical protein M0805_000537 [Coniferiporia weirii]|nr:hypothetical protein M0805_000537 [Coniferiporia weirii]
MSLIEMLSNFIRRLASSFYDPDSTVYHEEPATSDESGSSAETIESQSSSDSLLKDASVLNRKGSEQMQDYFLDVHPTLLEELEVWYEGLRPVDEEDINYVDGYENLPPPPKLNKTQRNIMEVASRRFTTKIVNDGEFFSLYCFYVSLLSTYRLAVVGICKALNLQILYRDPPDKTMHSSFARGGYGNIHAIILKEPQTFNIEVCDDEGVLAQKELTISKIAVKYDELFRPKEEAKFCIRMVREARIWSRMRHQNIVPLLGLWENFDPNMPFHSFVAPWYEEGNLAAYLKRNKTPIVQKLSFVRDVAAAIRYMHTHDFKAVHGDLRADNVFVQDGHGFLADFGISRLYDGVKGFTRSVEDGAIRWLAPERFKDDRATVFSDIYEFGNVFLEVCPRLKHLRGVNQYADLQLLRS